MPQISPMKWFLLNMLLLNSITQLFLFLNSKMSNSGLSSNLNQIILNKKISWKW